jgi:HEAT repeat protein
MDNDLNLATIKVYLKSEELHERRAVAEHLDGLIGSIDIFPVGLVKDLLDDNDDYIKEKALGVLTQFPEQLNGFDIFCIITKLKSRNRGVREMAAKVIYRIAGRFTLDHVRHMVPLLAYSDAGVRATAAEALLDVMLSSGWVGMDEFIHEIVPLLWHTDEQIVAEVEEFLDSTGQGDLLNQLSASQIE